LGLAPEPETTQLYREIIQARTQPTDKNEVTPGDPISSITPHHTVNFAIGDDSVKLAIAQTTELYFGTQQLRTLLKV
jgi:hypothetical protein